MFCISGSTIAWSSPSSASNSKSIPSLSDEPLRTSANLVVAAVAPDQINYGKTLNISLIVTNIGDIPAKNVRLYCNGKPGKLFNIYVIDQPFVEHQANKVAVYLDNLSSFNQKEINLFLQMPRHGQIEGEWSHKFNFDFSIVSDGIPESTIGTITLLTRLNKILVQKSGFSE
jgi:hypothetical protein